jgi:hypothetical protein
LFEDGIALGAPGLGGTILARLDRPEAKAATVAQMAAEDAGGGRAVVVALDDWLGGDR